MLEDINTLAKHFKQEEKSVLEIKEVRSYLCKNITNLKNGLLHCSESLGRRVLTEGESSTK